MPLISGSVSAATRVLDHIELSTEDKAQVVSIYFNVPVRYVSHIVNDTKTEIGIQVKVGQSAGADPAGADADNDLMSEDQLTWSPSAAIPLDKVVYQGNRVGTSSLLVSFATPVNAFQIRQGRNVYVMDIILPEQAGTQVVSRPELDLAELEMRAPLSVKSLPLVIYVINLSTQSEPVDFDKIPPVPVSENQVLYTNKVQLEESASYRLRLGFFRTRQEANQQLKTIKHFYPDAWVDTADVEERRRVFFERGMDPKLEGEQMEEPQLANVDPRLTDMMGLIRRTITAGEYAKAVRLLEALLEEPDNIYTQEALELLGLSRERNGQIAHAKAEYRRYLDKYPEGEDAARVWQRLLGLETAPQKPKEPLREKKTGPSGELIAEEEQGYQAEWETYGSISQSYRRDEIDSPFVEDEDQVSRSEIETFIDFNTRRKGETYDVRMKITGSYILDLLEDGENDTAMSDAYLDAEHRVTGTSMRFGRQRLRSSGILNRFDGLVVNYGLTPDVNLRFSAGLPVERSRDTYLHEHKQFAGISGDILSIMDRWDLSLFLVEQRVDGLVDRRGIGGEVRYYDPVKSLFSMVDYDMFHKELSIFMLQTNWRFENDTNVYMNLDYRNSPILSTSNALIGQLDPDTLLPITTVEDLQDYYSDDEIYDLAADRTARVKTLSFGVSHPYTPTLQFSGDLTFTQTDGTPESGGVPETEATGTETFYTFQVIKNDLLKQGDIGVFSLRYSNTSTSDTYRMGISSRYPVNSVWRINPRLDVSYRENDDNEGTRLSIEPYLRMEYRLRKSFTLEMEGGLNWYEEEDSVDVTNYTDYYFYAGYRWDF
ncbi:MAG: tetratricopeptide repeat protein [Candidatus Thiodiazotropha sp.]